jgi:predicted DNA-binding transcriptional regulator YafY
MKKISKISSTAHRVILLLLLLSKKDCNIDEISCILSNNPHISRALTKEIILKYINTLKLAGVNIVKQPSSNNSRYKIEKYPFNFNLSPEEIKTMVIMEDYVNSIHQDKLKQAFSSFEEKFNKYLPDDTCKYLDIERSKIEKTQYFDRSKYSRHEKIIKTYEKYCKEEQRITVKYKLPIDAEIKQVTLEPVSVKFDPNNAYICGYNPQTGEKQFLLIDYIQDIKQLPLKSRHSSTVSPVIFKLKGKLAKSYKPYEGEKVQLCSDTNLLEVSSFYDDKISLFKRLLRYGENCEVIYPKFIRSKFEEFARSALLNYS